MNVLARGFGGVVSDNNMLYLNYLLNSLIKHADPEADVLIDKVDNELKVTITPSNPEFKPDIIYNLLEGHRKFKIRIIFSKSLAISKKINYIINLVN